LSSRDRDIVVTLKPRYVELYRGISNRIPEFNTYEISYDRETLKKIIQTYGQKVDQLENQVTAKFTAHMLICQMFD
jgi:hypothetical protein